MSDENKKPSVELKTEEVKEILGHIPSWIVRWGMFLFFIILLLILFGSWVFKYPHIVEAKIKVTTENPPASAIARTNGKIKHLFVADNDFVSAESVLAIIENTAEYQDVILVSENIDRVKNTILIPDSLLFIDLPNYLNLGSIQPDYSSFLKYLEDVKNFIGLDYHNKKIESLQMEMERYGASSLILKRQSNILHKEQELADKQFGRDSILFRQGVIPDADYEKSRASLLQKQRAYEESRTLLVDNDISVSRLEQEVLDLKLMSNNEFAKLQLALHESFENLKTAIDNWEQQYLLRTSVAGTVSFTRIWSENQYVYSGDLVMTVIPEDTGEIIGKLDLGVMGSGKVAAGQTVNVKFDNFPYMEYGIVTGKIKSISLVTEDNAYSVLVSFPEKLISNYGENIHFSQYMQGTAEIITNEESLLARIVNPVKSVIMRQRELKAGK